MKHKQRLVLVLVALLGVVLTACGGGGDYPDADWTLEITGSGVDNALTLEYSELARMERITLTDVLMRKSRGEDQLTSWEGVPLDTILEDAGLHADASQVTIVAADGYAIEGTMEDLNGAIIALKAVNPETEEMTWLVELPDAEEEGALRLVAPDKPANFWVRQLTQIIIE